jgi:3-phosphoshikimate 1-carboxyvinyltransferase
MIKQLTILGLGLIGGSIARAIKPTKFCKTIVGFDTNSANTKKALNFKLIDKAAPNLATAVKNADLIIICVPVSAFANLLQDIKNEIKTNAVITDVSSVKFDISTLAKNILGKKFSQFVPGHPIAGSEKSGLAAAKKDLFTNHLVILTPDKKTNKKAIELVKSFWEKMNAKVKITNPHFHDQLLAVTSHLPQMLAYLFMNYVHENPYYPEILKYTGNGFKDFTRIAGSNPELWKDIILANADTLRLEIQKFKLDLLALQTALENSDEQLLLAIFTHAQQARENFEKSNV